VAGCPIRLARFTPCLSLAASRRYASFKGEYRRRWRKSVATPKRRSSCIHNWQHLSRIFCPVFCTVCIAETGKFQGCRAPASRICGCVRGRGTAQKRVELGPFPFRRVVQLGSNQASTLTQRSVKSRRIEPRGCSPPRPRGPVVHRISP